jgi:hypothetical protein
LSLVETPITLRVNLQRIVHLLECLLSLLKETKDNGPGELAIIFLVVHLQDLLKGHGIDAISQVRQRDRALFALSSLQSAFCVAHHSRMVLTLSSASRRVLSGILGRSRDLNGSLMLGIFGDRGVFQIAEEKGRPHVLQMVNSASTSKRQTSTNLNGYYSQNDQEFADDVVVDGD